MITKLFEKIYHKDHGELEQTCFSLYIQYLESDPIEESLFWIMSDIIPEEMISHFSELLSPKLIFKTQLSDPNRQYMEELLDYIAEQILSSKENYLYSKYYYPEFFFDQENNIRPEVCRLFNDARIDIRNGQLLIINGNNPLHLYYIHQLIRVPKRFLNEKRFSVERITRQRFESSLIDFTRAEEYVEVFSQISRFKLIRNRQKIPEYYIALDAGNQPILAITAVVED